MGTLSAVSWGVVLIILAVVGVVALIVWGVRVHAEHERQRKAALAYWASANGFVFTENDPWNFDARYQGVGDIGTGHARYAFELVTRQEPINCAIFCYHYKTWETRTVTRNGRSETETYEETHWRRYVVVELGAAFPGFFIRPEHFFDKIAGAIGFGDINFESEQFSSRYHVKSDDRQFAYALVHPQMMEWLLPQKFSAQLLRGMLVLDVSNTKHTAETCQQVWSTAVGFVNRIPSFVWQDYGKRPPVALPEPVPYVPPVPQAGGTFGRGGIEPVSLGRRVDPKRRVGLGRFSIGNDLGRADPRRSRWAPEWAPGSRTYSVRSSWRREWNCCKSCTTCSATPRTWATPRCGLT